MKRLSAIIWPIGGLATVAIFVVGLVKSGWTFGAWLHDVLGLVWPLAFVFGLGFLLAAHACKDTKGVEEAYPFMRLAALAFLLSAFVLWLEFRWHV